MKTVPDKREQPRVAFGVLLHATPFGRSRAAVLLVCGQSDSLWPACPMAAMLKARDPRVTVFAYPDAGHSVFGPPLDDPTKLGPLAALGGTGTGNNAARTDGWPKVIAFLKGALGDAYRDLHEALTAKRAGSAPEAAGLYDELDTLLEQYRSL